MGSHHGGAQPTGTLPCTSIHPGDHHSPRHAAAGDGGRAGGRGGEEREEVGAEEGAQEAGLTTTTTVSGKTTTETTQMKPTTLTSLQDGLFLQDHGRSLTCGTTKHCFLRPVLPATGPQCTRIRITQGEPTEASPTTWPWLGG